MLLNELSSGYSVQKLMDGLEGYELLGKGTGLIKNVKPIFEADEYSLCWLSPDRKDKEELIRQTKANTIVIAQGERFIPRDSQLFIKVANPKLFYVKILYNLLASSKKHEIHPSAIVHPNAKIHPEVTIGPYSVIGECEIGEGSIIDSHCKIGNRCRIGKYVQVSSGVVIGGDGFGYVTDENGIKIKFPHLGGVVIEDFVEIGANTCIDRGTLGNTMIREHAKIDNLVHVAHNVEIGRNTLVIANAMLGGSSSIGENSWIAPSATIRDTVAIGKNTLVGMGALVTKNIPDNETWAGFPAKKIS